VGCSQLRRGAARLAIDVGKAGTPIICATEIGYLRDAATFCTAIFSAEEEVERMCGMEQQGEAGCTPGSTAYCTAISSGRVVVEWG